ERRGEGERLAVLDVHVADIGRVDRLESFLAQRVVDGARDQVVRDVVQNLILEALLDDARRRLARTKSGHARFPGVVARDAVDLGADDLAGDLDAHVLARRVDVDEFGLHELTKIDPVRRRRCGPPSRFALRWTTSVSMRLRTVAR